MKFTIRLLALAALFSCIVWVAFVRFAPNGSPADSPASGERLSKVVRQQPGFQSSDAKPPLNSMDADHLEIASRVFAGESRQVQDALAKLLSIDPENSKLLRSSFNRWFSEKPELARKLAFLMLEDSSLSAGLPKVEKDWLPHELDQALAWITRLPAGDFRSSWMGQLGAFYTEVDPLRALAIIPATGSQARQTEYVIRVMNRWAALDMEKAGQYLRTMPAGPLRAAAEHAYLGQITERMPAAAATYVANEMSPDSAAQEEATRLVVTRWSHSDPAAVAEWLETFPASALKFEMIGVLLPTWAEKDPAAAAAWPGARAAPIDE